MDPADRPQGLVVAKGDHGLIVIVIYPYIVIITYPTIVIIVCFAKRPRPGPLRLLVRFGSTIIVMIIPIHITWLIIVIVIVMIVNIAIVIIVSITIVMTSCASSSASALNTTPDHANNTTIILSTILL